MKLNGKKLFLGRFENKEEAAFTRCYAETLIQKDFMPDESKEVFKNLEKTLKNTDTLKQTVNDKLKKRALI